MKKDYLDDCPEYLENFLNYLRAVKDRSERTIEAYYIDIRTFLRYLRKTHNNVSDEINWGEITIKNVPIEWLKNFSLSQAHRYLTYLRNERNNSTATRARKTSALKQFFSYLHKNPQSGIEFDDNLKDLELPRIKNKEPVYLSLNESFKLLENIDSKYKERDYCIILLFLNCGMRLSELVGLNLNDYSRENWTLRVTGKGNKQRIVYLNDICVENLNKYIDLYRPNETAKDKNAIFLSANKTRIAKRRVQQIVEENLQRAGLSNLGITTHKLRHTAATLMYQYGNVDPLVLRDVLGHKSIATTEIYTHLSDKNLREAANANPLSKKNLEDIDE